jgi:hypothetical protein
MNRSLRLPALELHHHVSQPFLPPPFFVSLFLQKYCLNGDRDTCSRLRGLDAFQMMITPHLSHPFDPDLIGVNLGAHLKYALECPGHPQLLLRPTSVSSCRRPKISCSGSKCYIRPSIRPNYLLHAQFRFIPLPNPRSLSLNRPTTAKVTKLFFSVFVLLAAFSCSLCF